MKTTIAALLLLTLALGGCIIDPGGGYGGYGEHGRGDRDRGDYHEHHGGWGR